MTSSKPRKTNLTQLQDILALVPTILWNQHRERDCQYRICYRLEASSHISLSSKQSNQVRLGPPLPSVLAVSLSLISLVQCSKEGDLETEGRSKKYFKFHVWGDGYFFDSLFIFHISTFWSFWSFFNTLTASSGSSFKLINAGNSWKYQLPGKQMQPNVQRETSAPVLTLRYLTIKLPFIVPSNPHWEISGSNVPVMDNFTIKHLTLLYASLEWMICGTCTPTSLT